jgi:hypothetical protein
MQESGLNMLLADPIQHGALVYDGNKFCKLWHERFGHLHYGALPFLKDHGAGIVELQDHNKSVQGLVHSTSIPTLLFPT